MPEFLLRFSLDREIPEFLVPEICSKLAYVDESIRSVRLSADGKIQLQLPAEPSPNKAENIEAKIGRVVDHMVENARQPDTIIFEDHPQLPTDYRGDPMEELLRTRQVVQEGPGSFSLGPRLACLIQFFRARFVQIASSFDAAPYHFPAVIPAEFLEQISYFRNFPHSLSFVTHLREDLDIIDAFAKQASCDDGHLDFPADSMAKVKSLLSPTVCQHLYLALANSRIDTDLFTATAENVCCRFESINMTSLERLWNFTMWEVIFVGKAERVLESVKRTVEVASEFFQEIGLAFHVENANDPFFLEEFAFQSAYQQAYDLKHEFRAQLPFKGTTLAIGSRNYHQDFFGRRAEISLADDKPVHTGCVGFGYERLAFAFVAQYGPDPSNWPAIVRDNIPKIF